MKNVSKVTTVVLLTMIMGLFSFSVNAQNNMKKGGMGNCQGKMMGFLNLSAAQQTQMEQLKTKHMQETQTLRNQMGEKKAHLQTLRTAKSVDMKAVNTTLKEISALQLKMAQSREAHFQEVRKILNDEQRVKFDAKISNKNFHSGQGKNCGGGKGKMKCGGSK